MDSLNVLKKLGFTEYEARAYLSLARLGPSSVKEIVLDSKLPRNKAYEALQRLEEKNRVMSLPLSPRKYKITSPNLLKDEVEEISDSVNALIKLMEQRKVTDFKDLFWVIKGRKALIEKFAVENQKAVKEILSCSELNKMLYKNMRLMKECIKKGVKVKFITPFDKKNIVYYKAWKKVGVKIRVFNEKKFGLLPRIAIIDGEKARLTVGLPEVKKEEEYITLWTESKAFANMLRNQFMYMWSDSKPIELYLKS